MLYGSVCSGIEAASVAWHPLGWRATWLSEIEAFPSAVLAHHYPSTPNLGDMTKIADSVLRGEVAAPDVLVGGTPCQAFSVAGLREGLADERGQLTIRYVELADAIDTVRAGRGDAESIIIWENVPGVLSSKDNAFGCFLAALAGEDEELQPAGGKWSNAGCVFGPARTVAWRVLDAQYFGVAQRRRRVFVVASAREGFDPAAVLFEFDGVRRDSAPSREAREETAGTLASRTVAARDYKCASDLVVQCVTGDITHTLKAEGFDASEDGTGRGHPIVPVAYPLLEIGKRTGTSTTDPRAGMGIGNDNDPMFTLQAGAQHGVAYSLQDVSGRDKAQNGKGWSDDGVSYTLDTAATQGGAYRMAVRRLTPTECERLQGFPDGYTLVPFRNKPAADGPRYKALGNSMAVPCMAFIGRRIAAYINGELE